MIERFEFRDQDFRYISNVVSQYAGIILTDAKRELVYGRLAKRLRAMHLNRFSDYCDILRSGDEDEFRRCVNAITTNMTSFFRENHHFEFLASTLIPQLTSSATDSRKTLRIWSAGCSTGEEAYSIAIIIRTLLAQLRGWKIQITASDLDSDVLRNAETGIYPLDIMDSPTLQRYKKWFQKGVGNNEGFVKLTADIRDMVTFQRLNLAEKWSWDHPFDIIFCRNVMIYFNRQVRQSLLGGFANSMKSDGYLFIGHSENLSGISDEFYSVGRTIYRKAS